MKLIEMEGLDKECLNLCEAINRIPGLYTVESCCGHGDREFRIWLGVESLEHLPTLLYYCDPCHVGFRWTCVVYTDCAMSSVCFRLTSEAKGEEAYTQAEVIAKKINEYLDEGDGDEVG